MTPARAASVACALVAALAFAAPPASAQATIGLARSTFAAGGALAGGGLLLRGALGQPAAGGIGGPSNRACSGIWCVPGFAVVGVEPPPGDVPAEELVFALGPMTPNPTRGTARIDLVLPAPGRVRLDAFDVTGRRVGDSLERAFDAGRYRLAWEGARAGAGVYFVRISVDGVVRGERRVVITP